MGLRKRAITVFIFLFVLSLIVETRVWAAEPRAVEIEARLVEFDPEHKVYKATGGVRFTRDDFRLQADTVVYYQETALVMAEHGVKLQTAEGSWEGESLVYSFRDEQGKFGAITGKNGNYYITGKAGELQGEEILLTGATFTPCELATPCLKIKAGKVRVVNDKVQVKGGWLYLKNLPVLPLPPVTVATDQFADWPRLEIGANSTRGFFVTGELTHTLTEEATFRYGGGVGTNEWWNVQAGLRWKLASGLVFNSTLTWEEYLRSSASLTYNHAPLQVTAAVNRNFSERRSGENSLTVQGPLTKKSTWQLLYTSSFNEKTKGLNQRQDYGLRITGRWVPGFTLGAGLYYGAGDLKSNSLNGWHLRTTWSGGINLGRTLRIQTAGEARWQTGIEPLWVEKTVKLVKDLHCFKVDLGYDLLDESYSFNFGFNW
ncbi:MAG: LPS-assembly protein LptD [Firmicutes bacterium]|nr:LPS-assembly protein LptD [Bacillota bacterium]